MVGGISSAWKDRDNFGNPQIEFRLDSAHSEEFYNITKENVGHELAVVLDGELHHRPADQRRLERRRHD